MSIIRVCGMRHISILIYTRQQQQFTMHGILHSCVLNLLQTFCCRFFFKSALNEIKKNVF